jgi:methionyl-tRNA formyltransferase
MILYLGPVSPLVEFLVASEPVLTTLHRVDLPFIERHAPDFIVSYNYRYIVGEDVLQAVGAGRAVNLHIAFLPHNRGAHPNFWSWVDGTPKGVTIHCMDKGLDTGDILAQREVVFEPENETMKSSYDRLQLEMQNLFRENWAAIRTGECPRKPQGEVYPAHRARDLEAYDHVLRLGWETPVVEVMGRARTK